jgi:hypothetical protein
MSRFVRRFAALAAIATLTFAQLAVSAFACPNDAPMGHASSVASHDEGCGGEMNPNLCDSHCGYGSSSVGHFAMAAAAVPSADVSLRIEAALAPEVSRSILTRRNLIPHPPPPLALLGVLRI